MRSFHQVASTMVLASSLFMIAFKSILIAFSEQKSKPSIEPWACPGCGRNNSSHRSECFYCHQSRPIPGVIVEIKKPTGWICNKCGSFVLSISPACYRCRAPRTADCREVGYIRKPDWICSSCGANVFPFRKACFLCGTSRMA